MSSIFIDISFYASGFITGAVVIGALLSKRSPIPARETIDEDRYPLDFGPAHDFRMWEGQ